MGEDFHVEVAFLSLNGCDLGQGQKLNVQVPADLDQLGSEDSHGAVVGGKGLVQLRHGAAYGCGSLHEVNEKTGIGHVQRRLHPGNPASNHHHRALLVLV
jgi:hypothetical protein